MRFLIDDSREMMSMKVKYFSDTDTALIEFLDDPVEETREISQDVYIDLDARGNIVSMTIEHAKENAHLPELKYEQIG